MKLSVLKILILSVFVAFLSGCGNDDDDGGGGADSFDRQAMLVHFADDLIIPGYDRYNDAVQALDESADQFSDSPNAATLDVLRQNWETALRSWQMVGFYDLGPAMDIGMVNHTNAFPVNVNKITNNISAGEYNLETADILDAVGFQAIDYLVFATGENVDEVVAYFETTPNARKYLTDLTEKLSDDAQTVNDAWSGDYRTTFVNATGTNIGSSTAALVNGSLKYFEVNLRDAKIGIPAGARTTTAEPLPDHVEARYNGTLSKKLLTMSIQAWRDMFRGITAEGINGPGFDDYIAFLGVDFDDGRPLQEAIDGYLEASLEDCEPLDPSLAIAVVNQQQQALDVFDELQRVVALVKVDMTSAMGIQITFVDNDGD